MWFGDVAEFEVFDYGDAFGVGVVAVVNVHQLINALFVAFGKQHGRVFADVRGDVGEVHSVFPFDGACVTMALQAARVAASTLSSVSCETLVNLWARLASANSRMNFFTWDLFIRLFMGSSLRLWRLRLELV